MNKRLVEKSAFSKLSDEENARLTGIAEQRAVDAGLAAPEDFEQQEDTQ